MASASSLVGDYTEARVLAELLRLGYDPVKPYGRRSATIWAS